MGVDLGGRRIIKKRGGQKDASLSRKWTPETEELSRILEAFRVEVESSPDNRLLKDI
jgi:hypothetical protein